MAKQSKVDIIKKIIDISPDDPGSLSEQYITKKGGKKLGPYWLFQTSIDGEKVSVRVPKDDVEEIADYIKKLKKISKAHSKKATKLLDTYLDAIGNLSPAKHEQILKKSEE
jgi:hypothetical protein